MSKPIKDQKEIAQVATIPANSDTEIGEFIAKAIEKVGKDGTSLSKKPKAFETTLEVVEGMNFDRGYVVSLFHDQSGNSRSDSRRCFRADLRKENRFNERILPLLQAVLKQVNLSSSLLKMIEGEALATLVVNRMRAGLKVCAVKAPGFGDRRKGMLQDIATLTGGQFISEELGMKLENVTLDMLGRAKKMIVSKEDTTLVEGAGNKKSHQRPDCSAQTSN